jgi:small subunit ribosomal protein S1
VDRYKRGQEVKVTVTGVHLFGVFVRLPGGTPGYIRQRELTLDGRANPQDILARGDQVSAVVIALPEGDHLLELSVRRTEPDPWIAFGDQYEVRDTVVARVKLVTARGAWLEFRPGVDGFVPLRELAPWALERPGDLLWVDDCVEAMVTRLNARQHRLRLSVRLQMSHMNRVSSVPPVRSRPAPGRSGPGSCTFAIII